MSVSPTLYIIYNAKSTMLGKLNYVYRKATCPDPESQPACAACELTHGPTLRLTESPDWIRTKRRIHNATVVQVHQDEMPGPLRKWMKDENVTTPAVVAESNLDPVETDGKAFVVLLTAEDLAAVRRDHEKFLVTLARRASEEGITGIVVE